MFKLSDHSSIASNSSTTTTMSSIGINRYNDDGSPTAVSHGVVATINSAVSSSLSSLPRLSFETTHESSSSSEILTIENDDDDSIFHQSDIVRNIACFIGRNQYRFVAAISRQFRNAYALEFPNHTQTYLNASTLEHAMICHQEIIYCDDIIDIETTINEPNALCRAAGRSGNSLAVEYLLAVHHHHDSWCCSMLCRTAAKYGHLHVLQYAVSQQYLTHYREICDTAAKYGHLQILEAFRDQYRPFWDEWSCANAAAYGVLHILQWYRHQGCPWNEFTCQMATLANHVHILEWAVPHGCPFDPDECLELARTNRSTKVIEWIQSQY